MFIMIRNERWTLQFVPSVGNGRAFSVQAPARLIRVENTPDRIDLALWTGQAIADAAALTSPGAMPFLASTENPPNSSLA